MIPGIVAGGGQGSAPPPGGWSTVASFTPTGVSDGWVGYTFRQRVTKAALVGATRLRVTLRCASGKALNVASLYVGNPSGDYAFAGEPAQILFAGMPGLSVSGGADTVSDPVDLVVAGNSIVLSAYFSGATSLAYAVGSGDLGANGFYKAGDDAANSSPSGYDLWSGASLFVLVERFD